MAAFAPTRLLPSMSQSIPQVASLGVNAQPFLQFDELHRTALVEANQEGKGF